MPEAKILVYIEKELKRKPCYASLGMQIEKKSNKPWYHQSTSAFRKKTQDKIFNPSAI